MADYDVTKNRNLDLWKAKKEGSDRASGYYKTQSQAEAAAKKFSSGNGGGEVRIHSPKGPIRDTDTVKPGNESKIKDKKH